MPDGEGSHFALEPGIFSAQIPFPLPPHPTCLTELVQCEYHLYPIVCQTSTVHSPSLGVWCFLFGLCPLAIGSPMAHTLAHSNAMQCNENQTIYAWARTRCRVCEVSPVPYAKWRVGQQVYFQSLHPHLHRERGQCSAVKQSPGGGGGESFSSCLQWNEWVVGSPCHVSEAAWIQTSK